MRGFLFGSFGLIVLYALVNNADNAGTTLNVTQRAITRLLSSEVAGVPDRAGRAAVDDQGAEVRQTAGPSNGSAHATVTPFVPGGAPWTLPTPMNA